MSAVHRLRWLLAVAIVGVAWVGLSSRPAAGATPPTPPTSQPHSTAEIVTLRGKLLDRSVGLLVESLKQHPNPATIGGPSGRAPDIALLRQAITLAPSDRRTEIAGLLRERLLKDNSTLGAWTGQEVAALGSALAAWEQAPAATRAQIDALAAWKDAGGTPRSAADVSLLLKLAGAETAPANASPSPRVEDLRVAAMQAGRALLDDPKSFAPAQAPATILMARRMLTHVSDGDQAEFFAKFTRAWLEDRAQFAALPHAAAMELDGLFAASPAGVNPRMALFAACARAGARPAHARQLLGQLLASVVQSSPQDMQESVWANYIQEIRNARSGIGSDALGSIEAICGQMPPTSKLDASRIWQDVLPLVLPDAAKLAEQRAELCRAKALLAVANAHHVKSEVDPAIAAYEKLMQTCPQSAEQVQLARRSLLPLLLQKQVCDTDAAQAHLDSLIAADNGFNAESWNWSCRLLFRRMQALDAKTRALRWQDGVERLAWDGASFADATLSDLDAFVGTLGPADGVNGLRLLTDLLLLAPDPPSMARLQGRRIAWLEQNGSPGHASLAARANIMLAIGTPEGPMSAVRKYVSLRQAAAASPSEIVELEESLCHALTGQTLAAPSKTSQARVSDAGGATSRPSAQSPTGANGSSRERWVADHALRESASGLLDQKRDLSPRRAAYANAFAGKSAESIESVARHLENATSEEAKVIAAFDDVAIVLAMVDGSASDAYRFAGVVASPSSSTLSPTGDETLKILTESCVKARAVWRSGRRDVIATKADAKEGPFALAADVRRAELASAAVRAWTRRRIEWGLGALVAGDMPWCVAFLTSSLESADDQSEQIATLDVIAEGLKRVRPTLGIEQTIECCVQIRERAGSDTARSLVRARTAALYFDEGLFTKCLSELDAAEQLAASGDAHLRDMNVGFLRALSWIRLGQTDDAKKLLADMESWTGTDEQRARTQFLIAWIHLQNNEPAPAMDVLRGLLAKYPATTLAAKATELVKNAEER